MKSQRNPIRRANRSSGIRLTRWVGLATLAIALNVVPAFHVNAQADYESMAELHGWMAEELSKE